MPLAIPNAWSVAELHRHGNRTRPTFPDGTAFSYAYDGLNRMTGIYEGAALNTLKTSITYDAFGRRNGLTRSAGGSSSYAYDAASRLETLGHAFVGGTGNEQLDFT